jgi:hypothetical protein
MTALSANAALTLVKPLDERHLPAQASVRAYAGSALTVDGDGNVGPLATRERFVGHAVAECNNSAGAAAALDVRVQCGQDGGPYILDVALVCTKENEGDAVYMSDDSTYTLDAMGASSPNVLVGRVWRYKSATNAEVQFKAMSWEDLIADGSTVIYFREDFLGDALLIDGSHGWNAVDVGDATEAIVEDTHGGQFKLTIAATNEAEDAVLYMGDNLQFDIDSLIWFKVRAKVTTPGAGVTIVWGMAGAHNLAKDSVAQHAWFRCEANLDCKAESDDGTNDNDDKTVATIVTDVFHDWKIDFQSTADVKFFQDGAQVATGTTFDMSNYTAGLQPYFSGDKASGAVTGALTFAHVEILAWRQ